MAELSTEHKVFIVRALARMMSPSEVVEAAREEFVDEKLEVSRQQVRHYNPAQSPHLGEEWRVLFSEEHERFKTNLEEIPIANKATRLRLLDAIAAKAHKMKNYGLEAKAIEQAAKEMGGAFTNRTEITGAGGGAVDLVATVADYRQATQAFAPAEAESTS